MAGELALAGHEICAVARGEHLHAMRRHSLRLIVDGRERVAQFPVSGDPGDFGPQDSVICALKAHQAYEAADQSAPLLGDATSVVTAMNGIPWWYFYKDSSAFEGLHLDRGTLEIEITIDDPNVYTKPVTVKVNQAIKFDTDLLEVFCENEKDQAHMVGK